MLNVVKKLPRLKARIRGLYRRVVLPTKVVCLATGFGLWMNTCAWSCNDDQKKSGEAYFRNWQHSVEQKTAANDDRAKGLDQRLDGLNKKQAELDHREHEFNLRVGTFNDIINASALVKNVNDPSPTLNALKRNNLSKP